MPTGYSFYSPGLHLEIWQKNRASTTEILWLTSLTCLLPGPLRKNYTNLFLSLCTGINPLTYLWRQVKKSLRAGHCIMPVHPPTRPSPAWSTCQWSSNVADEIIYSVSFSNYLPPWPHAPYRPPMKPAFSYCTCQFLCFQCWKIHPETGKDDSL